MVPRPVNRATLALWIGQRLPNTLTPPPGTRKQAPRLAATSAPPPIPATTPAGSEWFAGVAGRSDRGIIPPDTCPAAPPLPNPRWAWYPLELATRPSLTFISCAASTSLSRPGPATLWTLAQELERPETRRCCTRLSDRRCCCFCQTLSSRSRGR